MVLLKTTILRRQPLAKQNVFFESRRNDSKVLLYCHEIVVWTCHGLAVYFTYMGTTRHTVALITFSLIVSLPVSIPFATELVREEPIPIQMILANPQAFNMRAVRLQGTIKSLQVIPDGGGCQMQGAYDAYLFLLDDHTGELLIIDRGKCLGPRIRQQVAKPLMTEFSAGEHVEVVIDVSVIYSPNFDSRTLEGVLRWVKRIP